MTPAADWRAIPLYLLLTCRLLIRLFHPMTEYTGRAKYILREFGIAVTLVVVLLAAYFWKRKAEVSQPRVEAANA